MDKQIFRTAVDNANVGSTLTLGFVSGHEHLNGDYEVIVSKIGRGRNGSRVLEVKNLQSGETLTGLEDGDKFRLFGSGCSDFVVSLAVNGVRVEDAEVPVVSAPRPRVQNSPGVYPYTPHLGIAGPSSNPTRLSPGMAAVVIARAEETGMAASPKNAPFRAKQKKLEAETVLREQLAGALKDVLEADPRAQFRIRMKQADSSLNGEFRVRSYLVEEENGSVTMELVSLENPEQVQSFNTNEYGTEVRAVDVIEYS